MPFQRTMSPITRFWSKVDRSGECWTWMAHCSPSGYGQFYPGDRDQPSNVRAHRYSYTITYGPIPDGLCVLHRCDNPPCVRPDHLFLGTNAENTADRHAKGRSARGDRSGLRVHPERAARGIRNARYTMPERTAHGERHGNAKLTEQQAKDILALRTSGRTGYDVASYYGVCAATVSHIWTRRSWKHL